MAPKRKYSFAPWCANNNTNSPDKNFLSVLIEEKRRKLWFQAVSVGVRYTKTISVQQGQLALMWLKL